MQSMDTSTPLLGAIPELDSMAVVTVITTLDWTMQKVAERWVGNWDPTGAQSAMEQILTKLNNKVGGVVSPAASGIGLGSRSGSRSRDG